MTTIEKTTSNLIYLISCLINGNAMDKEFVKSFDFSLLYRIAERHLLTSITAFALESVGLSTPDFAQAQAKAIRKSILFDSEKKEFFRIFDAEHIWYMPLKGDVLKELYPSDGMRQMADVDVLFDESRAEDVRRIFESRGFEATHFGESNHDCYNKEPVYNFEMHRSLFGDLHEPVFRNYYRNVKERLVKGDGYEHNFTPEDFYVYMIAHEYKHYSAGGTGLRSLLDTYVYLKNVELDMEYVAEETEKLGIGEFEQMNRSLALHLFQDKRNETLPEGEEESEKLGSSEFEQNKQNETLPEGEQNMLNYIIASGTYGTFTHTVENKIKKKGSKIRYTIERFTVPVSKKNKSYKAFARQYPTFYKHKILLPLLPFYRTYRSMKEGRFKSEARAIRRAK